MEIYIGETSKFTIPTHLKESYRLDVPCHQICASKLIAGYIYDLCTKRAIKGAKITIQNANQCETCLTNKDGYYKLYASFLNTHCDICIRKSGFIPYCEKCICINSPYQNFGLYPEDY